MRADADDAVHADAGSHVLARPAAHDRDERVAPDEPLELRARLRWRGRVLRPLDDRRQHPVEVEEQSRLGRISREPREEIV